MENLIQYQSFNTIEEMDKFVENAVKCLDLCEFDAKVLRTLARYSCKVIGVSWLKTKTLADILGVSYKTVQRALQRLKKRGVIKRIRTIRPTRGGFGASVTIICPIDLTNRTEVTNQAPEPTRGGFGREDTFPFVKLFKPDIENIRQQVELDHSYLSEFVPEEFVEATKPFLNPEEVYSLWFRVLLASRKYAPLVANIVEPAIRAFKASVWAYKMRRVKKSFGAYFYGALAGIFSVEQRKEFARRGESILTYGLLGEELAP